jgi:glycosyltransferase involved in cell wall biosynthesis
MRRRPSSSSRAPSAGSGKAAAPDTGPTSVLVSILTSSSPDLLALCYESVAASVTAVKAKKYSYTVRVIVNSTDHAHYAAVRAIVPASVSVVRTESNGRPGKGHNSVLENFRSSPGYQYCVLVDGDDFLYPRALARLESYLAYGPDVLLLAFHDKLTSARAEHEACVPHFSVKDKLVWFYNLTDATIGQWYESKSISPFKHDATELNTPARPLVFSRRALDFDLAYDENARLYDDFVVCCKCLERSVLGDLRVFGVVDSHVYLYNRTTPTSASARFGAEQRAEENENFRASLHGKFLAIQDWAARLRDLRLLELSQVDEPDHIAVKYRFVEWLAGRMDHLSPTVVPCDNARVVATWARDHGLPSIDAEMESIYRARCARSFPLAITVCAGPRDVEALAHTLDRTARLAEKCFVVASGDDAAVFASRVAVPSNVWFVHRVEDALIGIDDGTMVLSVGADVCLPPGLISLVPERLDPDAVYVANSDSFCVYAHDGSQGAETERTERPERPEGHEGTERTERPERPEGHEGTERPPKRRVVLTAVVSRLEDPVL